MERAGGGGEGRVGGACACVCVCVWGGEVAERDTPPISLLDRYRSRFLPRPRGPPPSLPILTTNPALPTSMLSSIALASSRPGLVGTARRAGPPPARRVAAFAGKKAGGAAPKKGGPEGELTG